MLKRQLIILWIGIGAMVLAAVRHLGAVTATSWEDESTWQGLLQQWRTVALVTVLLLCLFRDWTGNRGDGGGDEGAAFLPVAPDQGPRVSKHRVKREPQEHVQ